MLASAYGDGENLTRVALRYLIMIGEPFAADLYRLHQKLQPRYTVVCAYGCTETQMNATLHCPSGPPERRVEVRTVNVSIGTATMWHFLHVAEFEQEKLSTEGGGGARCDPRHQINSVCGERSELEVNQVRRDPEQRKREQKTPGNLSQRMPEGLPNRRCRPHRM